MDRNKLKEWWGKITKGKGSSTWLRKDRLLIRLLSGVLLLVITLPVSDGSGESERSGAAAVAETASWFSALEFSAVGFSAAEGIRKLDRQHSVIRKWDGTYFCNILRNLARIPGFPQTISRPCR